MLHAASMGLIDDRVLSRIETVDWVIRSGLVRRRLRSVPGFPAGVVAPPACFLAVLPVGADVRDRLLAVLEVRPRRDVDTVVLGRRECPPMRRMASGSAQKSSGSGGPSVRLLGVA